MMELKVDRPALAGQDIDPNTFQRVWNRVMPDQAALPDNAVPAVPTVPSAVQPELPPVPDCPAQELPPVPDCPAQELPPVPDCPAQELPPVPDCPAQELSPVPDCPAQELPSVPDCPVRPSVPGCPSCPAAVCLGEASKADAGRLEELMALAKAGTLAARTLVRRSNGPTAKAMSLLAKNHRLAFRRLSAAYFLITGKRYTPQCLAPVLPSYLPLALRQQFVWEQRWEQKNRQAAQNTSDPCLKALYLELAQEGAFHAGTIRSLLEQMG